MFSWVTGKNNKHKKHDDRENNNVPSAPDESIQPDLMEEQKLKHNYKESYKLHIEKLHQQRVELMQKQTIYKDTIWSAVVTDLTTMNSNDQQQKPLQLDVTSSIEQTDIDLKMDAEEQAILLIVTTTTNEEKEKKERDEALEQYKKKQELKKNLKKTAHKTAEYSKYAWKKSVAFGTVATSKILSATNNVLNKIEQSKQDKQENDDNNNGALPSYNSHVMEGDIKEDDSDLYNDEGVIPSKKKSYSAATWGFLEKNIIDKYKNKKSDDNGKNGT